MKYLTLRKEYFGGILHDARTMSCELLNQEEFNWLAYLIKEGKKFFEKEKETLKVNERFKAKLKAFGKDFPSKVRVITPPKIPDGCLSAPLRVYDHYTLNCNLSCKHCGVEKNFLRKRRTIEETKIIMKKFYEAGTMEWRFTGGEPTICPDLVEAIKIAKSFGMAVMLTTNGCVGKEKLLEILNSGLDEIIFSLEGNKEIHDKRRGHGTFEKLIEALEIVRKYNEEEKKQNVKVTINTTVAKDNVNEAEHVVRLGAKYGYNVNFTPLRPYGQAISWLGNAMLSPEEFLEFSRKVEDLREDPEVKTSGIKVIHANMDLFSSKYQDKSKMPYPFNFSECTALSTAVGLCPDGRVNICSFLMKEEFLGPNLLEVSVYEAWLHPKTDRFRRIVKTGCIDCKYYMRQCKGKCRAMVFASGGGIKDSKLVGEDPYCFAHLMRKET